MKKTNTKNTKTKQANRLPTPPWQAQLLQDIIDATAEVLGEECRSVFSVLPRNADARMIRRALIATHLLAARLEEELAAVQ